MFPKFLEKKIDKLEKDLALIKRLYLVRIKKTNSSKDVIEDFRKTHLYSEGFLKDLGAGLQKSSYGKK